MIKFEVRKSGEDQWYARIVGANGEVLFTSETYHDIRDAAHACQLVGGEDVDIEVHRG